jgi:hypothetical protein
MAHTTPLAYGTLQCFETSRHAFNWNYRALWFGCRVSGFSRSSLGHSLVDLFLLASLPLGWREVMPFVITFLAMDVILATLACILEHEPIVRAPEFSPCALFIVRCSATASGKRSCAQSKVHG